MNRNIILIALLGLLFVSKAVAQSVTVEAKIDSLQILIGEQAKVQLQVAMDAKQRAIFPAYTDTLVRGVEIIETVKPDTQFLNDRQRMVDTLHPDQFFGQKPVMKAPFAWEDWYGLIACSFLALPLLGLLIYLIVRIRDNKPIIRKIKVEPKLPPHQAAMKEIERIKTEKVWQKGQSKEYYTELTDAIRTYIKDRFGFNALEMTSSEIIDQLLEMNDKEAISDLKLLFQTADLVKFAKHNPQMNENDANLINAIDFINETKQPEEENQKPQPTEITIIEKRSLRVKAMLICGIALLSAALIGTFIYIGLQLYNLFV